MLDITVTGNHREVSETGDVQFDIYEGEADKHL